MCSVACCMQASEAFGEAMADAVSRIPYWATVPAPSEPSLVPEAPEVPTQAAPPPPALPKPQKPLPKSIEQLQDEAAAQQEQQQLVTAAAGAEVAPLPAAGQPAQEPPVSAWAEQPAPAKPAAPPPLRRAPARPAGAVAPVSDRRDAQAVVVPERAEQHAELSVTASDSAVARADHEHARQQASTPETAEALASADTIPRAAPEALPAEPKQGGLPAPVGPPPTPPALPKPVQAARPPWTLPKPAALDDVIGDPHLASGHDEADAQPAFEPAAAAEEMPGSAAGTPREKEQAEDGEQREQAEDDAVELPGQPELAAAPPLLRPSPMAPPRVQPPSPPSPVSPTPEPSTHYVQC